MKRPFTSVEKFIDQKAHAFLDRLPRHGLSAGGVEFLVFGLKQAWACLFGAAMLGLLLGTHFFYPENVPLRRYDFLFLASLAIQITMIVGRLETNGEVKVILIYHLIGTVMELFKTHVGSWVYPEENFFRIGGVPLFSGFMYAAVGSYIARIHRLFDIKYSRYPVFWATIVLCFGIYANFFTHHYIWDFRWVLFAATITIYFRCWVHFRVFRYRHKMPLLVGFFLVALFIWFAENIGTYSRAWLYPSQMSGWAPVSPSKLGAWYLLMIISYVLVTLVNRPQPLEPGTDGPGRS